MSCAMRVKVRDELGYAGKGRDGLCYAVEIAASPSAAPRNDKCFAMQVKVRDELCYAGEVRETAACE